MYRCKTGGEFHKDGKTFRMTEGDLIPDEEFEAIDPGIQAVWLGNKAVELVDADSVANPEPGGESGGDTAGPVKKSPKPKPVAPATAEAIP